MAENEMVGWHHQLNGHELEQTHQGMVEDREAWCITGHRVIKSHKETEQQCCEVRFVGTFL